MKISVTEQGLVIPKEFLVGIQAMEIQHEQNRIVLTPTHESESIKPQISDVPDNQNLYSKDSDLRSSSQSGTAAYVPKTPLGKKLSALRQEAITAGMKLISAEEIEQEVAEQRDRHQALYENLT